MKVIWIWTQTGFAALGGFLGWYLGGASDFLYALVGFVAADYITGVLCAFVEHRLSSAVGARGIAKKVSIFVLVGIGHLIDAYVLRDGEVLRTALIFFYIANEGISLIENAAALGLPVPAILRNALEKIKDKSEEDEK